MKRWKAVLPLTILLSLACAAAQAQPADPASQPAAEPAAGEEAPASSGFDLWQWRDQIEVGIFAGLLITSPHHQLYSRVDRVFRPFDAVAPDMGLRLG